MTMTTDKRDTSVINNLLLIFLSTMLCFGVLAGCEGPSGSKGAQGPEGPEGPVGPAGDDGSMMYSGQGAPGSDVGSTGDYYLNTNTGEMYGPKDDNGWGNPIIGLMGQDGEDGSQIHSGTGAPAASLGAEGDYYLDKSSYELYGPKTGSGWGTPINLKGADGNANVIRYRFFGHDFSSSQSVVLEIDNIDTDDAKDDAWLVYLVSNYADGSFRRYHIPGYGSGNDEYKVEHYSPLNSPEEFSIELVSGTGLSYSKINILRIEGSKTTFAKNKSIIPENLNVSDYSEVANYYNFRPQ